MAKPKIVVFSGPTSTLQSTAPLVTSNQARRKRDLPLLGSGDAFDALRPQRLAKPVTVYIEAFTGHPLERDAIDVYGPPDGFLNSSGNFHETQENEDDVAVFEATLAPEDGLYLLPYMAVRADGHAFEADEHDRQHHVPDASRIVEEIDRFGLDVSGSNNLLSAVADYTFVRAAPSGGYLLGHIGGERTDEGGGDINPELPGVKFFPYSHRPTSAALVRITNVVNDMLQSDDYLGAIWLEGSPAIEETGYWLNLLVDTRVPICCNASQRPHGVLSNDGDRNIVDSVAYIVSRAWADEEGADRVGSVVIQDQQVFTAREVQKADARPGGYLATGGHGGVVGSVAEFSHPRLTFIPTRRHTHSSELNLRRLPERVTGVRREGERLVSVDVLVKDGDGHLAEGALPKVTMCKHTRFQMEDPEGDPHQEVEISARIARNLECFPLSGFVLEGNSPFGKGDQSMTRALELAVFSGMPVVSVGRGNADGFTTSAGRYFVNGSNLTATKARLLLMAALLRFGAAPLAEDPLHPTAAERSCVLGYREQLQAVFDTH